MTTEQRAVAAPAGAPTSQRPQAGGVHARPAGHPDRAVLRLTARLVRRGGSILVLAAGAYVAVEAASYLAAYPDAAARERLAAFGDVPASRILQGVPHAVDTVGGFVVWDGGWVLQTIVAVWAVVTTGRLLRGEEDAERAELVLAGPVAARRTTGLQLAVILAVCAAVGVAVAAAVLPFDSRVLGSVLLGAAVAGFAATYAGVTAVIAQLLGNRRRVVGAAAAVLGLGFLLRMVANSSDGLAWVGWFTPYGWTDQLRPFGDNRWWVLAAPLAVTTLLAVAAVWLRGSRDTGAGLLGEGRDPASRLLWLGSPLAFAWRSNLAVLVAWAVGLAAYGFVMGALVTTVADFLAEDPAYREMLEAMGMDAARSARGFVGVMAIVLGLVVALYTAWRIGAARGEESSGRAEHLLTRPVSRWRWLGGHVLLTALCAVGLTLSTGLAVWLGAAVTGAEITLLDSLRAMGNTLPAVAVFAGVAVLVLGLAPRLTVALTATAVVAAYVLEIVGPALDWPAAVVGVSPFHHLAYVPAEPFAATAALVMTAVGVAATVAGMAAFARRDLAGA